ncbi:hypothetical protein H0H93_004730 [Arthromyces matolae]|nr:hypothetical protein H0H93_004730 [Arthromyces matolae]
MEGLTSLTHTSYPTFLSLHQTTTALSSSLNSFSSSLKTLVTSSLPALQEAASAWNTRTTSVLAERSKARVVLDHHDKIRDLLDIPIFIDSCVRNGYFQEALALSAHVRALASRPDPPSILKSVHAEVEAANAQMLLVLLATLNEPGRKLPALWKAVNFLRKMDAFGKPDLDHDPSSSSEELLALAFLSGRLSCLASALEPISRDIHRLTNHTLFSSTDGSELASSQKITEKDAEDIARSLKKYIDVWREGAYDILTQYSTIFLEPPPSSTSSTSTSSPSHKPTNTLLPFLPPHLLTHLLPLLEHSLPLLPLPLLPPLLTQLTYCAHAFARLGLDFSASISVVVAKAVAEAVRRGVQGIDGIMLGLGPGKKSITNGSGAEKRKSRTGAVNDQKPPSQWLISSQTLSLTTKSASSTSISTSTPPHIPPTQLTTYPPLARFTNSILGVLNALRLLAPLGVMKEVMDVLDGRLAREGEELMGYLGVWYGEREEKKNGGDKEKAVEEGKIAKEVGEAYFGILVPSATQLNPLPGDLLISQLETQLLQSLLLLFILPSLLNQFDHRIPSDVLCIVY